MTAFREHLSSSTGTPIVVDISDGPLLTFLHLPTAPRAHHTAVLFCPPFGWEEVTSYRARRVWAQRLAAAGHAAARFDLPGTGDSGGGPHAPGLVGAWSRATAQMISWLRERAAAERLAVVGVGVGGLLAWEALTQDSEVEDLILWGVPADGDALLRELQVYACVVGRRHPHDHHAAGPAAGCGLESMGYALSPETVADLRALKPAQRALRRPPQRVLLLGRDQIPAPRALRAYLRDAGAEVSLASTSDYQTLLGNEQDGVTPDHTIARTIAWISQGGSSAAERAPAATPTPATSRGPVRELPAMEFDCSGVRVREEPFCVELDGERIFGILTTPVDSITAGLTAVFPSVGVIGRAGPNRLWVEMARRWATRGLCSLRFDQPGAGDSDGDARELLSLEALYSPQATRVVLHVLDQLAARDLPDRFVLTGFCSGAYWALHCALADERIMGALMINLYAFQWSRELVVERSTATTISSLQGRAWSRLAHADVTGRDFRERFQSVRLRGLRHRLAHRVEDEQRAFLEYALDTLTDHGTEALLLFSEQEGLLRQLVRQGYVEQLTRWPNLSLERIRSSDHNLRAVRLQMQVQAALDRALDRVLAARGDSHSHARA